MIMRRPKEITSKLREGIFGLQSVAWRTSRKTGLDIGRAAQNIHLVTDALGSGLLLTTFPPGQKVVPATPKRYVSPNDMPRGLRVWF